MPPVDPQRVSPLLIFSVSRAVRQILVQHIRVLLPELKARINAQVVTLQKELASYGEMTEKVCEFRGGEWECHSRPGEVCGWWAPFQGSR